MNDSGSIGLHTPEWVIQDGLTEYPDALAHMQRRVADIRAGSAGEQVWLVEHPPLYTAGTSAKPAELIDPARLPTFNAGRGGQWTYHGPGQRTGYVMLDLNRRHGQVPAQDVRCYVNGLEEWLIRTLDRFNVKGERREGRIGIWVADPARGTEAKIAAIGVRVTRWVTWHGVALNVEPDLSHFGGIVPCGLPLDHPRGLPLDNPRGLPRYDPCNPPRYGVTSLADLGIPATMHDADLALRAAWDEVFSGGMACCGPLG